MPAGDSGVTKTLADALGNTAQERATMAPVFEQIKQAYETEVAKEGKSNNLAAAMTLKALARLIWCCNRHSRPAVMESWAVIVCFRKLTCTRRAIDSNAIQGLNFQ